MSTDFKLITQKESWANEINENVIEQLEELLHRAREGEIAGLAYACITKDNSVLHGYTKHESIFQVIGGLEYCKQRLISNSLRVNND